MLLYIFVCVCKLYRVNLIIKDRDPNWKKISWILPKLHEFYGLNERIRVILYYIKYENEKNMIGVPIRDPYVCADVAYLAQIAKQN